MNRVEARRDVGRVLEGGRIVDGTFGTDRPEPFAMVAGEPRRHPTAVRATEHADAVAVAEVVAVECGVDDRQDIVDVDGSPSGSGSDGMLRTHDRLAPRRVPTAAPSGVAGDDDEPGRRLHLELVVERLAVLCERSAVNVEQHRVATRLVEVRRPHDPGVDLAGAVGGSGREPLPPDQVLGQRAPDVGAAFTVDEELRRVVDGHLRHRDDAACRIEGGHGDRTLGDRCRHERPVGRHAIQVGGSAILGDRIQMGVGLPDGWGCPDRGGEGPVEAG